KEQKFETVFDEERRQEAVIVDSLLESRNDEVGGADFDLGDVALLFDKPRGTFAVSRHADVQNDGLADLLHDVVHAAVDVQDPLFDDADLVADVGQLGEDVAGDHDGLVELSQALEKLADFNAGPRVETAGRLIQKQHLRF